MDIAQDILSTRDRTPKEIRDMAEIRDIGAKLHGKVDWNGDCVVYYFVDGSSLMMVLDENMSPTEFLAIHCQKHEVALAYSHEVISSCTANGITFDADTLSHNIESNFPHLNFTECDEIAELAMMK